MVIARCTDCGKPKGIKHTYVKSAEPVGYPDTACICGTSGCENPALIWLNEQEAKDYEAGATVFDLPTKAIKVKVQPHKA